jgi:hypothetical protein
MRILFIIVVVFLNISHAEATTVPKIGVTNLLDKADIAAIVRIESGEIIAGTKYPCGVKYQGKILQAIKNVEVGESIEFGYYIGYGVGEEYIVFLNKKEKVFTPMMSTNSHSMKSKKEFEKHCGEKHSKYIVMHHGYGIQKTDKPSETNYRDEAFLIPTRYLGLPNTIQSIAPTKNSCETWEECKWVKKETMLDLLSNHLTEKP